MQFFDITHAYKFLGGFYMAMAVLHVILYIYSPRRKANLIYAIGMLMVCVNFTFTQDAPMWSKAHKVNVLTDLAANGALLYFVSYSVVSSSAFKRIIRTFVWIYAVGFAILLFNSEFKIFNTYLEIILRAAIYVVIGTSCILGLVRRVPNFLLIVMATLFLLLMHVLFGADFFNIWKGEYPPPRVVLLSIGFTLPFVAYSSYLAKYVAVTRKTALLEKLQAEKGRELDQLKNRFFTNISHEFRTPLTLILGPLERRMAESVSEEEKVEFDTMHRNASQLLKLVNQLLDLSRIEAGMIKLKCRLVDINDLVRNLSAQFTSLAASKNIAFTCVTTESLALHTDVEKFEKIFINLLANAFKFTPAGGRIEITTRKGQHDNRFRSGYAEISITDSGPGIAQEHLPRVFDRFYQPNNSNTLDHEGSGIGLALTKELVELHHGSLTAASEVGKGSTFTVMLPLGVDHLLAGEFETGEFGIQQLRNEEQPIVTSQQIEESEARQAHLPRVLIAEDNEDLRHFLKKSLSDQFAVSEAVDGQKAIEIALQEIPDLIITDLIMPNVDGLELCKRLKADEKTSHVPILVLTAKADVESKIQGLQGGADDYILKPFEFRELMARVENLIAARKRFQRKFVRQMNLHPSHVSVESADKRFLKKAMEIVEANIEDSNFGVEAFAREAGVSHTQLYRKIQGITGFNPNEFIRHLRLERAAEMLRQKSGNVSDIAYKTGFNNLSYFAKVFKEKFGMAPGEFLKSTTTGS